MNKMHTLILLVTLLTLGCGGNSSELGPTTSGKQGSGNASTESTSNESIDDITDDTSIPLVLANLEEIKKTIAESGTPVVLDVWSTACDPCMKEFPGLVSLHEEFGGRLTCVSVCVDYFGSKSRPPERFVDDARKFLKSVNSTLTNYLSTTPDSEVLEGLDVISIPAVLIFNADGTLAKSFVDSGTSPFSYEKHVTPFVREMLEKESS